MFGVIYSTLLLTSDLLSIEFDLRSVAKTTPLSHLIPIVVTPCLTALRAYSICTNLPLDWTELVHLPLGVVYTSGWPVFASSIQYIPRWECSQWEWISISHCDWVASGSKTQVEVYTLVSFYSPSISIFLVWCKKEFLKLLTRQVHARLSFVISKSISI